MDIAVILGTPHYLLSTYVCLILVNPNTYEKFNNNPGLNANYDCQIWMDKIDRWTITCYNSSVLLISVNCDEEYSYRSVTEYENYAFNISQNVQVFPNNISVPQIKKCSNSPICPKRLDTFLKDKYITSFSYNQQRSNLVPLHFFDNLHNLKVLVFNKSPTRIAKNTFSKNTNLEYANFSYNDPLILDEGIFNGLSLLKYLDLSFNGLRNITKNHLANLSSLQYLDLSGNLFTDLPPNLLEDMPELLTVKLASNRLHQLHENLFSPVSKLKTIDISNNKYINLSNSLLSNSKELRTFSASDCMLDDLPSSFSDYFRNLITLNLNGNNFEFNLTGLFMNQRYLEYIDLSNNRGLLKYNVKAVVKGISMVKVLKLGYNCELRPTLFLTFTCFKTVEEVYLNNNCMSSWKSFFNVWKDPRIPSQPNFNGRFEMILPGGFNYFNYFTNIGKLILDNNEIDSLNLFEIGLINASFSLRSNRISHVYLSMEKKAINSEDNFFDSLLTALNPKLSTSIGRSSIRLEGNPFVCDCDLFDFYDYLKNENGSNVLPQIPDKASLQCGSPPFLKQKKILSLQPTDFRCSIRERCPTSCECYRSGFKNGIVTNCTKNNLKEFPLDTAEFTTILDMGYNILTDFTSFKLAVWKDLTELYLDHNQISTLDSFVMPSSLTYLDIRSNYIQSLSSSAMSMVANHTNLTLMISGNPWKCDCSNLNFIKWLKSNSQSIGDFKEAKCNATLSKHKRKMSVSITELEENDLCPQIDLGYISLVILAPVGFLLSALYYKNKRAVKVYTYTHLPTLFRYFYNEKGNDEEKPFDAFLSYCSKDLAIAENIVKELEEKEPFFKICVHDRNWIAGELITTNITLSVEHSCRTILLLSKGFLDSKWFMMEFQAAYFKMIEERINRIIIILYGELPLTETLDKDLQYVLSTKTYLVWGEKYFWEKLRYAMPHRDLEISDNIRVFSSKRVEGVASTAQEFADFFREDLCDTTDQQLLHDDIL